MFPTILVLFIFVVDKAPFAEWYRKAITIKPRSVVVRGFVVSLPHDTTKSRTMREETTVIANREDLTELELNLKQAIVSLEAVTGANLTQEQRQNLEKATKRINNALMVLGMIY